MNTQDFEKVYFGNIPIQKTFYKNTEVNNFLIFPIGTVLPFTSENFIYKIDVQTSDYPTLIDGIYTRNTPLETTFFSSTVTTTANRITQSPTFVWILRRTTPTPWFTNSTLGLDPSAWIAHSPRTGTLSAINFYKNSELTIYPYVFSTTNFVSGISSFSNSDIFVQNNTVYGYTSSTTFKMLTSLTVRDSVCTLTLLDLKNSNFKNLNNINVSNVPTLKKIVLPQTTLPAFRYHISSNSQLLDIQTPKNTKCQIFESAFNSSITSLDIQNLEITDTLSIISNNSLSSLNWPITTNSLKNLTYYDNPTQVLLLPELSTVEIINIFNSNLLTDINFSAPNVQNNLKSVNIIRNPVLTGSNVGNLVDYFLNKLNNSLYSYNSGANILYSYTNINRDLTSDNLFLNVYKKTGTYFPVEIDAYDPNLISPNTYIPSTENSYTIFCAISSLSGSPNLAQEPSRQSYNPCILHPGLTADFIKTGNIYNNRDVFSNSSDYHILFNNDLKIWTVVGPTSSSNYVWLSAFESIGNWGNPPSQSKYGTFISNELFLYQDNSIVKSRGWMGPAYCNSGWLYPSSYGPMTYQATTVFPTSLLLYKTRKYTGTEPGQSTRIFYSPLSGYSNTCAFSGLDFSGIAHQANSDTPGIVGRGFLISPIHYATADHFPVPSNMSFYNKDGTVETRNSLSAIRIGASDIRIGILNAPVSATYYQIAKNFKTGSILQTKEDFKKLIYGPNQNGKVGYCLMDNNQPKKEGWLAYLSYTYQPKTPMYTVPSHRWHGEPVTGGDSTTQLWVVHNDNLISIGHTYTIGMNDFGNFVLGDTYSSSVDTINQTMTALSLQFFGPGTNTHTLSVYEF